MVALGLVDFSNFDLDNDGVIEDIAFFHSGYAAEWGGINAYGAGTPNCVYLHLNFLHLVEIETSIVILLQHFYVFHLCVFVSSLRYVES